jgi:hypothetical protein
VTDAARGIRVTLLLPLREFEPASGAAPFAAHCA